MPGFGAQAVTNNTPADKAAPRLTGASVNGATRKVTLTYSEALKADAVPGNTDFSVLAGTIAASPASVAVDGSTVTLTLHPAAAGNFSHDSPATLHYTVPSAAGDRLQDLSGNQAAAVSGRALTNNTPPRFSSAAINGAELTVTFDGGLDEGSVPAASAFTVTVGGSAVDLAAATPVAVGGSTARLRLAAAVLRVQTVTVAYAAPQAGPLRDADRAKHPVPGFGAQAVTNNTPADKAAPRLTGASVNGATLTLTFSEALDTGSVPAGVQFSATIGLTAHTPTGVRVEGETVTLTFTTTSARHGQSVELNYTKPGSNPLRDLSGNAVASFSRQSVTNNTPPRFASAAINGAELTVTFDGGLDSDSVPAGSAFTVTVGGSAVDLAAATPVAVSGSTATLTLASEVLAIDTVTVAYAAPQAGPLRDADRAKHPVPGFGAQAVTNNTPADSTVPTVRSAAMNGGTLTLTFSEALDTGSVPAGVQFSATIGLTAHTPTGVRVEGETVTLTFTTTSARHGQSVELNYTKPGSNPLRDLSGNAVASFSRQSVTNNTPPRFASAAINGAELTVTFDGGLDSDSVPAGSAFTVTVAGEARDLAQASPVAVSGSTVTLTLASPAFRVQAVTVAYAAPQAGPLRDADNANEAVPGFGAQAVTNNTPADSTVPTVRSAAMNGGTLTLTFSEALDTGSVPAGVQFSATIGLTAHTPTGVRVEGETVTLTFTTTSARHGQSVELNYTKPGSNPLRDLSGNAVASFSRQSVTNNTPPRFASAAINGAELTVTFDGGLDSDSVPAGSAFTVTVAGEARDLAQASPVAVSGSTVTLTLASPAFRVQAVTVAYAAPQAGPLRDADNANEAVPGFGAQAVTNNTPADSTVPTVRSAAMNGGTLTLTFSEALDTGSVPAGVQFSATIGLTAHTPTGVRVEGETVTLTFTTTSARHGQSVELNYTKPGSNPLRDLSGNAVASFSRQSVTNNSTAPKLVSAAVNGVTRKVTLTYDEALKADAVPGASSFTVVVGGAEASPTGVAVDGSTVTLTLHVAATGNLRHGATDVELDYTPPSAAGDRLQDLSGNQAAAFTDRALTNNTPPRFSSAAVDRTTLTVTFDGDLDPDSVPAPGDFHVTVGTERRNVANGGVAVSGATATLTLAAAVRRGDTVKVRYTAPASNPLRDADNARRPVPGFSDRAVTNKTPPPIEITEVAFTREPPRDSGFRRYGKIDDPIEVTVTFNQAMTVTRTPRLKLTGFVDAGGAAIDKWANYFSGSPGAALVFRYTIARDDTTGLSDSSALTVGANALAHHGGSTIRAGARDADLSHAAVSDGEKRTVNARRLSVTGAVGAFVETEMRVDADLDGAADTLIAGQSLDVVVRFGGFATRHVSVDANDGGTPANIGITLDIGGTERALPLRFTQDDALIFGPYTVQAGDNDADGVAVVAKNDKLIQLMTSDATITSGNLGGNNDADLEHAGVRLADARMRGTNAAPAGSDVARRTGEDADLAFALADFPIADSDGDPLKEIRIVTLPEAAAGKLELDGADIPSSALPKTVTRAQLESGALVFDPVAAYEGLATFTFRVVDSFGAAAAAANTATVRVNTGPAVSSVTVDGRSLAIVFDQALDPSAAGTPAASAFTVTVGSGAGVNPSGVSVSGSTVTLTLATPVTQGQMVSVSYAAPATGGRIRSADGIRNTASFSGVGVTNHTDRPPPAVSSAAVEDASLAIVFDEALDPAAAGTPPRSAFRVAVGTASGSIPSGVAVSGSTVTLTLATAVRLGQTVSVSYTAPSSGGKIRSADGIRNVASFSGRSVTNNTRLLPAHVPNPDWLNTVWSATLTVQASGTTLTGCFAASPCSDALTGDSFWYRATPFDRNTRYRVAQLTYGTGNAVLRFDQPIPSHWTLHVGDDQYAVSDATLSDGEKTATWARTGSLLTENAQVSVSLKAHPYPWPRNAKVVGATMEIGFNRLLDESAAGTPPASAFTWRTNRVDVKMNPVSVSVSGSTVILTLATAVKQGQGISVTYTPPATGGKIRRSDGNRNTPRIPNLRVPNETGTYGRAPRVTDATRNGNTVTLAFDQALETNAAGVPDGSAFRVHFEGSGSEGVWGYYVSVSGNTVTFQFQNRGTVPVRVRYIAPETGGRLLGLDGNLPVADFSNLSARDVTFYGPVLDGAIFNGRALSLSYSKRLDVESVPAPEAFSVSVNGVAQTPTHVTLLRTYGPETVTLTLPSLAASTDTVTVSYAVPASNPIRDTGRRPAAALTDRAVTYFETAKPDKPKITVVAGDGSVRVKTEFWDGGAMIRVAEWRLSDDATSFRPNGNIINYLPRYLRIGGLRTRYPSGVPFDRLTNGKTYWVRVAAANDYNWDGDLDWAYSDVVSVTPTVQVMGMQVGGSSGRSLSLSLNRELVADSPPPGSAFAVTASCSGAARTTAGTGTAAIDGDTIRVALAEAVADCERLAVRYTRPETGAALRDADGGLETPAFSAEVREGGPEVAIVSDPGPDATYGAGDTIRVRLAYDEAVTVDTSGGTPRLKIRMDPAYGEKWAAYESGSGTEALVFAFGPVAPPNLSPGGIAVLADTLELNGGAIAWAATGEAVALDHAGLDHDPAHKVDHRAGTAPELASAGVAGAALTLTFDEVLDPASAPAGSAFTVTATPSGGEARSVAGTGTAAFDETGRIVTVALAEAVAPGETLAVAYAVPGTSPLRGVSGQAVAAFSGAAAANATADTAAPALASASVDGAALTLTFDEALDATSAPAGSAFTMTATPEGGGESRSIAGTGTAAFDNTGRILTVTLAEAVAPGETLAAAYAVPDTNPLRDLAENPVAAFSGTAAANATSGPAIPSVTAVSITSVPAIDTDGDSSPDTYGRGETVEVTVTWDADVTWDLSAPGSTLRVRLDVGGTERGADLVTGGESTGTARSLAFRYETHRTDRAPDGVFPLSSVDGSLVVPGRGATLRDAEGRDAARAHASLAADPAHRVDGSRDASPPAAAISSVALVSTPATDTDGDGTPDTYGRGETIEVTVTWDADVTWDLSAPGSTLRVRLDVGGSRKAANLVTGGETAGTARTLAFRYQTHRTDRAPDGVFPLSSVDGSLVVPGRGATLRDAEGRDAARAHAALAANPLHRVHGGRNAAAPQPRVRSAALLSDPGAHGVYGRDDLIQVALTFSETVHVDTAAGTPSVLLKFDRDPTYPKKAASYASGSGTDTLVFAFGPLAPPNHSSHGVALLADTLALNGGAIRSVDSLQDAALAHAGLDHDPGHRIDTVAPFVQGASVDGNVLTVLFDEDLDPHAPPAASAFTVMAGDTVPRRINGTGTTSVAGPAVTVTLASPVRWDDTLRAYYVPDGVDPARDLAGNPAPALLEIPAANNTPRPNRPATGAPAITGLAQVGQTLTASTTGIADPDGMTGAAFTYQWSSNGGGEGEADADITGATASTYELVDADEGRTVRVRVSFTDDAGFAETLVSEPTEPVAARPLTAEFVDLPDEHRGYTTSFDFGLVFSEDFPGRFDYKDLRAAFVTENGRVVGAERAAANQNQRWTITARPWSHEAVTVTLPAGSVSTASGRPLANTVTATVQGPPGLSVADAEVDEDAGAPIQFAVTLDRAPRYPVSVDWATEDGTATAGEDYTAASGTLAFAVGETDKTITVEVLDDDADEGEETFLVKLSNPQGAHIADGEATGTIVNSDPLPRAWTARFGRTVAFHLLDALEARLEPVAESYVQLGGHRLGGADPQAADAATALSAMDRLRLDAASPDMPGQEHADRQGAQHSPTVRDLLLGTAFHLASEPQEGDRRARLSAWGRVASTAFDGADDDVSLNGTVTTATLGVDGVWQHWLTGVALAWSEADGTYNHEGTGSGDLASTLTSVHPYVAYTLSDRVRLWGMAGWGSGIFELVDTRSKPADLQMAMGALGIRGTVLATPQGLELALRSDVLFVQTDTARTADLVATSAATNRLRLLLQASRPFTLNGGGSLIPSLEAGVRRDGGDAETGTGLEVGGRLQYTSAWGLSIEAALGGLLAHEDAGYREWGFSGALRYDPGRQGRGLTASLLPTWGTATGGAQRLWEAADPRALTAAAAPTSGGRMDAELAYGFDALRGRGLLTPYARVAVAEGGEDAFHLGTRLALAESLELTLEAGRRARQGESAAHELALRATLAGW